MTARAATAALLLALAGCGAYDEDEVWILPPISAEERPAPANLALAAAVGTASIAGVGQRWNRGERLRLGHVLGSVDASYPLLSVARQERILAEAKQLSALGAFDPTLRGSATWAARGFYENHTAGLGLEQRTGLWGLQVWGGYRLGSGDFDPTFDGKRVTNHGGEFHAGLRLPLLRGRAIDPARRDLLTSALDREIAELSLGARRLRFMREAAHAYWRWVAAGRRLNVARELLRLAEVRQAGADARVRRGDLAELEAVDNRRLVVRRRGLRIGARRQLERATLALSLFLRDAEGQPIRPPATALPRAFPTPAQPAVNALSADLELALQQRPELASLTQEQERASIELRLAENQRLPQLDFTLVGSQDLDRSQPSPTKGPFELVAGLSFGFPLFNRKARGKALAQKAKIVQLSEKARFMRDRVQLEVRDALSALQAAYERVSQERESASLARRVAAGERRRFDLGDSTILLLNLREQAIAEADLRVISALQGYWTATATYEAVVGGLPARVSQ